MYILLAVRPRVPILRLLVVGVCGVGAVPPHKCGGLSILLSIAVWGGHDDRPLHDLIMACRFACDMRSGGGGSHAKGLPWDRYGAQQVLACLGGVLWGIAARPASGTRRGCGVRGRHTRALGRPVGEIPRHYGPELPDTMHDSDTDRQIM